MHFTSTVSFCSLVSDLKNKKKINNKISSLFSSLSLFLVSLSRTPLHCAASCNNVQVCKFLVESGAAVFAMTYSDMQTAADKCEEMEEGYTQCSQFLYGQWSRSQHQPKN